MQPQPLSEKIAIVGMGCVVPDAINPTQLWNNILDKKISIAPINSPRLDLDAHYRPEMQGVTDKQDKTYTKMVAQVQEIPFDGRKYRIPPAIAAHMDDGQKVALIAAEQALQNVKLDNLRRERVSVFMGGGMLGNHHHNFQRRTHFDRFEHNLRKNVQFASMISAEKSRAIFADLRKEQLADTISITEDSAPGILPNIVASRISSVFDFHGHAYIIDAACASGLAAIICGVQHLVSGESDAVICGATDMTLGELGMVYFSAINALSPNGSFPFDERADGFVIGQGGGTVVLKRMGDALRDGDPIYAVITGYGQNSDGKGKAIAAPNPVWQSKAIRSAIEMAGYPAESVELIEAHGTATKVGDVSEVSALKACFQELGVQNKNFCALGSVKSNIGHLKSAAGIPAFIKTTLALHHKVLPPSANCKVVNPKLELELSPFYVNTEVKPWPSKNHPRRAGVSSFGFGGANYHIALEEFRPGDYQNYSAPSRQVKQSPASEPDTSGANILFLSGASREEIQGKAARLQESIAQNALSWSILVQESAYQASAQALCRLAVLAGSEPELRTKLDLWKKTENPDSWNVLRSKGIFYCESKPRSLQETAFLFPGQGSQYADMLLDIPALFPAIRRVTGKMDAWWKEKNGISISELIRSDTRGKAETEALLKNTRHTHPALLYGNLAMATLLQDMGVCPRWMIGHSAGEIVALAAAKKITLDDALQIMDARSRAFVEMDVADFGKMAAVRMPKAELEKLLAEARLPVTIANINSLDQLIVSGATQAVEALYPILAAKSIKYVEINVSHAFHSPLVAEAGIQLGKALQGISFETGFADVLANETCTPYPHDSQSIRDILQSQVTASVNFCGGIQALYEKGVRLFIEVGPNPVLGNLTQSILMGCDATVVSLNHKTGNALDSLQKGLATLFAEGIPLQMIHPAASAPAPVAQIPTPVATSPDRRRVLYSGVSVGLPGSYKKTFQDDNFEQLFAGNNFIERLTDPEKRQLAEMHITKVEKTSRGPVFKNLDTLESVIQLAGRIGKIDPLADYALDPKEVEHWGNTMIQAVAAGYEALRDAHIPLVREANSLNSKWVLPSDMRKRTGVVFAHGFPMIETVAAEVSRFVSHKFGTKLRADIFAFYEELLLKIQDPAAKRVLTDWYVLNHKRLTENPGAEEVYTFNHQFINQISGLANNRLASCIGAMGPNFQVNAACSSTSTAITLCEEMIRSGRVDRMIIIGADNPTSPASLPFLGAAFLSTGAATSEADLYKAALPFDLRRNGMIMSAGAIGIVLEAAECAAGRGVSGVCELMGSHVFNTAGHLARLDIPRYAEELEVFMANMESTHGIRRQDIASKLLYVSHETYTPPRGGCSESEAVSLRHAFGENFTGITVTNTKGMTGHTMGASIEDVLAARALEWGKAPPVVNHREVDPALQGLNLFRGGAHHCEYALRMAAGFGAQGNYILLRKIPGSGARMPDQGKFQSWLKSITGIANPQTEVHGRILRVPGDTPTAKAFTPPAPTAPPPTATAVAQGSAQAILQIIAGITGYSSEMLELDMELEADLGVDTVKQATILAMIGERFGIEPEGDFQLSAFPTIGHIVQKFAGASSVSAATVAANPIRKAGNETEILQIISGVTGYPPEMLELDMELEADLGVDTVKQATILAMIAERFGMEPEGEFQLSAYPTLGHILRKFATAPVQMPSPALASPVPGSAAPVVLGIIAEITGYPPEMLELDMELEADLGVDTVKQATILAILGERFGKGMEGEFQLSAFPTIGHLVSAFAELEVPTRSPAPVPATQVPLRIQELTRVEEPLGTMRATRCQSAWILGENLSSHETLTAALGTSIPTIQSLEILDDPKGLQGAQVWIDVGAKHSPSLLDLDSVAACRAVARNAEWRFALCKQILDVPALRPEQIIVLSATSRNPLGGLLRGFYLSLGKEWNIPVTIVEMEDTLDAEITAQRILSEITHNATSPCIVYQKEGRFAYKLSNRTTTPPQQPTFQLGKDDVILVSGGANGISAEAAKAIAQAFPCRMVILGRTPLPQHEAILSKAELQQQLAQADQRATPARIEREYQKQLKQQEVFRTVAAIQAMGREVQYRSADITDFPALQSAVASLPPEFQGVSAILHGAGLDFSHLLAKKSAEEFALVHRVKTWGALHLSQLFPPESLKLYMAFTSISGVFGNAAQLDYSAGNAFLDAWVGTLRERNPQLHAMSLAWSGWSGVGMAWRNDFVREHAAAKGLHLIPLQEGTRAVIHALQNPPHSSPSIFHCGLGDVAGESWFATPDQKSPLIDRIEADGNGNPCAYHTFSVKRDEFLHQHRLGKTPLLPGVGCMEFMAEFHSQLETPMRGLRFRDLSFHNAFKLHRDEDREAFLRAEATAEAGEWAMKLFSAFQIKGSSQTELRDYGFAKVSTGEFSTPEWKPEHWAMPDARCMPYSDIPAELGFHPQDVNLGPLFHDSKRPGETGADIIVQWNAQGIHSPYKFPLAHIDNPKYPLQRFRLNFCLLDSIHQTAVVHTILQTKSVHLPLHCEELVVLGKQTHPGTYQVYAQLLEHRENAMIYDIFLLDELGSICAWAKRISYQRIHQ